jgi:tetratricopeptide (TPR) repeat protein
MDKTAITAAAQKFLAKGQIDMAIAEWEKLIGESNEGNVYNTIGDLYLKKNSKKEAVEAFARAADIFRKDGFTLKAIALYKKILNISPSEVNALVALAELNEEKGLTGNAIENFLAAAEIYKKENKTDKALNLYQKIIKLAPRSIHLKLQMAELYLTIGLSGEAAGQYAEIAAAYIEQEDTAKAEEFYLKAINIVPDNIPSFIGLSRMAEGANDIKKAFEYIGKAFSFAPENREVLRHHSILAIKTGDLDHAKRTLLTLLKMEPSDIQAKKLIGSIYLKEGNLEEAWHELMPYIDAALSSEEWDHALEFLGNFKELEPTAVRHRFARAYKGKGDKKSAVNELRELAKLYADKDQFNGALQAYKDILELNPDDEEAKTKIGEFKEQLGLAAPAAALEEETEVEVVKIHSLEEEADVIAPAEKVETLSKEEFQTKKAEADFYSQYGFKDQAAKLYESLLRISPDNSEVREKLNALKSSAKPEVAPADLTEAEEAVQQAQPQTIVDSDVKDIFKQFKEGFAKSIDDKDSETHYNMGIAYKEMGILEDAIKEFQISLKDPKRERQSISMIALCHIDMGNYPEAVKEFNKIISAMSPGDEAYLDTAYDLATAYMKNKDYDNALKLFVEIHTKDSGFRDAAQHIESLKITIAKAKANPKKDRVSYL